MQCYWARRGLSNPYLLICVPGELYHAHTHILYIYIYTQTHTHIYIIYIYFSLPHTLKTQHVQRWVRFNSSLDRLLLGLLASSFGKFGPRYKKWKCTLRWLQSQAFPEANVLQWPHVPLWKLCGKYHHRLHHTITLSCFTLPFYLAKSLGQKWIAFANTSRLSQSVELGMLSLISQRAKQLGAVLQGLETDPAPKPQPNTCPEYKVGPHHWLCQLKLQKGPFSWE